MSVKLKPNSQIKTTLGINEGGDVHAYFTNLCYNYMDKYVPYSGITGKIHLRENVDIGTNYISYEMPYAYDQYIGIVNGSEVMNYTTPNTGSYWDKKMVSAEFSDLEKELQDYTNRR